MGVVLLLAVATASWPMLQGPSRASAEAHAFRSSSPDFNGDGFADLAIGVPLEDVGTITDAGAVQVLYGAASGLQAVSPDDQFITQSSPGVKGMAEEGDSFGLAVGAADFNGDGFSDLAVGVGAETVGAVSHSGAVQVLYGAASGLQAVTPDDQLITQDSPGVEDVAEDGDLFGAAALAGADFNGDGFADLTIGIPAEDVGTEFDAGAAQILFGSAGGLQAISPDDRFITQDTPDVEDAAEQFDQFGSDLATSDFNGDGFLDLAVGVSSESVGDDFGAGAVQVLYGSGSGPQAISPDDLFINQDSPGVKDQVEENDHFGSAVAAADFNADGYAELAVGVPLERIAGFTYGGALEVLFGSASGLTAEDPDDQFVTQDTPGVKDAVERFDSFAAPLVAADFNEDGFTDLALGVSSETVEGAVFAGAVALLYGSASGLQATSPDDQFATQDTVGVKEGAEGGDSFGFLLATADFNGDGFPDLAGGTPFENVGPLRDAGVVQVVYGSAFGVQAFNPDDQLFSQDSPGVEDGAEEGDQLGRSLAAAG